MTTIQLRYWFRSVINSYGHIFFSKNKILALIVLLVTFGEPKLGLIGFSTVLLFNINIYLWGANKTYVEHGVYGFNALLLGLILAVDFEFNYFFLGLWIFAIALLTVITLVMSIWLEKIHLPFLVFPFIFTYWVVALTAPRCANLCFNLPNLYIHNAQVLHQQSVWYMSIHLFDGLALPPIIATYLRTLAAILFQNSVLLGLLLAFAILYSSRIIFSLTVIGFVAAWYCYRFFGVDMYDLTHHFIGINFMFVAVALGGFYIVPSALSYLLVIGVTPLVMFLAISLTKMLAIYELPSLALAFCTTVSLFLYYIIHVKPHRGLQRAIISYASPEETVYKHITSSNRFKNSHLAIFSLPFFGEWTVSQGYNGAITHLPPWDKALDFVITDEDTAQTYKNNGTHNEDFFAYDKALLAPADGYVYQIIDNVEDNPVGGNNVAYNWGNTIILNHCNGLFSQLSHIKEGSFKVKVGDYVTKGTILAQCGNSGRSPESHIHFQVQTEPTVGAKTFAYPMAYFLEKANAQTCLKTYDVPAEGTKVSNIEPSVLLSNSFGLLPGQKIIFKSTESNQSSEWEVFTNAYNQTYIYCSQTQSYAYFVNDKTMFYFTDFNGDTSSLLFYFYLANYRILQSYQPHIVVEDEVPLIHFHNPILRLGQDFIAPFKLLTKVYYQSRCSYADNSIRPTSMQIESIVRVQLFKKNIQKIDFNITLKDNQIHAISIITNHKTTCYIAENSCSVY